MATRIELDTKALASIIGGDSEVELHLRKQIVCEFTRKYLVKLVKDEAFQAVASEISSTVRDVLKSEYGVGDTLVKVFNLSSEQNHTRDRIRALISEIVKQEIEKAKSEITEVLSAWNEAQKEVWKGFATRSANSTIREEIKNGVMKALESALKE